MATPDGTVARLTRRFNERAWESRMAPRLKSFLDLVWQNRAKPNLDIYQLYSGRAHDAVSVRPDEPFDHDVAFQFLKDIGSITADGVTARIQYWGPDLPEMWGIWGSDVAACEARDASVSDWVTLAKKAQKDWVYRDLAKSFFHFRRSDAAANYRVYVNILPAFRARVTSFVVNDVFKACPDITNAKVLGPLNVGFDTMVIYLARQEGQDAVVGALAEYQAANWPFFGEHVVAVVKPIKKWNGKALRGVACACEPYEHYKELFGDDEKRPSFGDFWEMMLEHALDATRKLSNEDFYRLVLMYLEQAKIDPLNPHL